MCASEIFCMENFLIDKQSRWDMGMNNKWNDLICECVCVLAVVWQEFEKWYYLNTLQQSMYVCVGMTGEESAHVTIENIQSIDQNVTGFDSNVNP